MTLLERYRSGEHEDVWNDMISLGESVRSRRYRGDAEAVARETMRRARRNVEMLIPRLDAMGYRFHSNPPFSPPTRKTADRIRRLEKLLSGRLPLSLAAWWQEVGAVSLQGEHPLLQAAGADPLCFAPADSALEAAAGWTGEPPFFPPPEAWRTSIEAWRRSLRAEGRTPEDVEAHLAPSIALFEAQDRENLETLSKPFDARFRFAFAPDELTKADVKGGTFDVLLPNPTADFPLEGAAGRPWFVQYLRQSFSGGGFRGWALRSGAPRKEIEVLTKDLLRL